MYCTISSSQRTEATRARKRVPARPSAWFQRHCIVLLVQYDVRYLQFKFYLKRYVSALMRVNAFWRVALLLICQVTVMKDKINNRFFAAMLFICSVRDGKQTAKQGGKDNHFASAKTDVRAGVAALFVPHRLCPLVCFIGNSIGLFPLQAYHGLSLRAFILMTPLIRNNESTSIPYKNITSSFIASAARISLGSLFTQNAGRCSRQAQVYELRK